MRIPCQAVAALLLAALPAQARVLQPERQTGLQVGPAAHRAEAGGQKLRRAAAGSGCTDATAICPAPLSLSQLTWFSLSQIEMLTQVNAIVRAAIAAERLPWRAPRLTGHAASPWRVLLDRQHNPLLHPP